MKLILSSALMLLITATALAQSSATYITNRTHISINNANLYVENINAKDESSIRILEASNVIAAGQKNTLANNVWDQSDNSTFKFIAYPSSADNINQVKLAIDPNIVMKNVSFLIPASSTFSNIVLTEELSSELRVTNKFDFPNNHLLYLGSGPKTPEQSDINNVMNLKLSPNTLLNNGEQRYNSFIVTPGHSSLEQYIDHTEPNNLTIFPVGDNENNFLPVGIYKAKKSAYFKVTASELYYKWNLDFLNIRDNLQIDDIRKDYVEKTWNIRHNLVEDVDAVIILQHPSEPNIAAADYLTTKEEEDDRTMISRYQSRDETPFNRQGNNVYGDRSITSNTFWENLTGSSEPLEQLNEFGRANLVPPPEGETALSHFAYISDINPSNTYFMKVGVAEDSLPMGRMMQTPIWQTVTAVHGGLPGLNRQNAITFTAKGLNAYRIREVELRYTTDPAIGQAGLPDDADPAQMKRQIIYFKHPDPSKPNTFKFDQQPFDAFDLEAPAYDNEQDIYYRFYPKGYFPYDPNQTVEYIPSPVGILQANALGLFTVTNNVLSITDNNAVISVKLPSSVSKNVTDGVCYFVEPISKHIVHKKDLTQVGSNWQAEIPMSELVTSPLTTYVILVETTMLDGSTRKFHKKFVLQ